MAGMRPWSSMRKKTSDTPKPSESKDSTQQSATKEPAEIPEVACEHMELIRLERVKRKILKPSDWSCSECGTTEGVWACLICGKFGCGRYQGEHALAHYESYEHPLALEINQKYCHCYVCDGYVSNDNKKEDLEALRKLLEKAQNADESMSTTRSGKVIRPLPRIQNSIEEFEDEDRLHTAVKHWRLRTFGNVFQRWRGFVAESKTGKKQTGGGKPMPTTPLARSGTVALQSTRIGLTQSQTVTLTKGGTLVPGVTGLRNLGNTCFMNTVLQALSNTAEFCNFFVHILGNPQADGTTPAPVKVNGKLYTRRPTAACFEEVAQHTKVEDLSLTMQLHTLLRVLWSGKWAVATPHALLESVWKFVPKFRNRQQQDAQEFLCYLFDRLQQELQEIVDKPADTNGTNSIDNKEAAESTTESESSAPKPKKPARKVVTRSAAKKEQEKQVAALAASDTEADANKENTTTNTVASKALPPTPTIVTEIFQGKLLSEVVCGNCKNKSAKVDPFLDLSIDIPVVSLARPGRGRRQRVITNIGADKKKGKQPEETKPTANGKRKRDEDEPESSNKSQKSQKRHNTTSSRQERSDSEEDLPELCKLEDCLRSFVKPEVVEGYMCEKCKTTSNATKRLYLHTLPRVLCVVLKRFCWTTSSRAKIDTQIQFPFVLDMKEFSSTSTVQNNTTYDLTSLVLHHGAGLLSGHYTSYCYNKLQNVWVHYNDSRVGFVTKDEIEREAPSKAYLLFYERHSTTTLPLLNATPNKPFKLSSSLASFTPITFNTPPPKK